MKRTTWGVLVLLLGSGGCISFYPEPVPEEKATRTQTASARTWTAPDGERMSGLSTRFRTDDVTSRTVPPPPAAPGMASTAGTTTTAGKLVSVPPPPASMTSATRQVSYVTSEPAAVTPKLDGKVPPKSVTVVTPTKAGLAAGHPTTADQTKGGKGAPPLMRMVNSKRITLNFEVKDVGPSGLSSVELWYTQDCKDWKKHDAPPQAHSYVVEVDEEGMYGFTLLAKSGLGLGKEPPAPGDLPQVWVMVDLSKPVVTLGEITPNLNGKTGSVAIRWKATDKNLGSTPVGLYYAEKDGGPWQPIATGLENNGRYVWQVPASAPASFFVRVDATDLAGNMGRAQTAKPVLLDTSRPTVSILDVESAVK